jgi:hypothetical protein
MPRIHTVIEGDHHELARRVEPRDDAIVAERAGSVGDHHVELEAIAGPFSSYRRRVSWSAAADERVRISQEVEYRLAIPYWSRLYDPLVRRAVRNGVPPGTRPWWTTPDRLSPAQSTMVAAMAMFNLVAGLLYGLLTQVLTFVSADLGDGSAGQQTALLSVVRIGVVITMAAMFLADRKGRRRIEIVSFTAAALLTVLGAAAPTWWVFGALQFVARNLAIAGLLCVDTISVEELPPGSGPWRPGSRPRVRIGSRRDRDVVAPGGPGTVGLAADLRRRRRDPAVDLGAAGTSRVPAVPAVRERRCTGRGTTHQRLPVRAAGAMFFLFNMFVAPASQLQNDYCRPTAATAGC